MNKTVNFFKILCVTFITLNLSAADKKTKPSPALTEQLAKLTISTKQASTAMDTSGESPTSAVHATLQDLLRQASQEKNLEQPAPLQHAYSGCGCAHSH